jgi:hypothetical protein
MSWIVSAKQYIPAVIGEEFGGGYFAGYISHTADGNPTHALIVAPRATGATGTGYTLTTNLAWGPTVSAPGAQSSFNGQANTAALVTLGIASYPAANFCVSLNIGGFSDWYLPARYELDIAYFNLKPTTNLNNASWGQNIYSVPLRASNWSVNSPAQTSVTSFNTSAQAFVAQYHYSSTEASAATRAWSLNFQDGLQSDFPPVTNKAGLQPVRAFRRIAL